MQQSVSVTAAVRSRRYMSVRSCVWSSSISHNFGAKEAGECDRPAANGVTEHGTDIYYRVRTVSEQVQYDVSLGHGLKLIGWSWSWRVFFTAGHNKYAPKSNFFPQQQLSNIFQSMLFSDK